MDAVDLHLFKAAFRFDLVKSRSFGHSVFALQQLLFFEFRVVFKSAEPSFSGPQICKRVSGSGVLGFETIFGLIFVS